MKTLLTLALALVLTLGTSMAEQVKVKANLHCGSCQSKVEKAMETESGVKSTTVDLAEKMITIDFDESKTNSTTLVKAISDLGYSAEEVKACSTSKKECSTDKKECSTDKKANKDEASNSKECGTTKCCTSKDGKAKDTKKM